MTSKADTHGLTGSPLIEKNTYVSHYKPELLFALPRQKNRDLLAITGDALPFYGFDTWNAYELSWLNQRGKPMVAIMVVHIACDSLNIIESKSFKLYLNSFNNTRISTTEDLLLMLEKDISHTVQGEVKIQLFKLEEYQGQVIQTFTAECIDDLDIMIDDYEQLDIKINTDPGVIINERLCSHLLKSNCLVTGQPDWGSLLISYQGPKIERESLLRFIVASRNHNEFHEQCVERIFMALQQQVNPQQLTVQARYVRRGGLDINPIRSSKKIEPADNIRMARQ